MENQNPMIDSKIREVRKTLFEQSVGCIEEFIDLAKTKFVSTDEEMYLELLGSSDVRYHFKMNRADPRNAKTVFAHKQFCKNIKVPYSFFRDNRPALRNDIVEAWQKSLQMQNKDANRVFRLRRGSENQTIRAVLPDNYTCLNNFEIIDAIIRDHKYPMELNTYSGSERDDPVFHARILIGEEFEVDGNRLKMGVSITASELGATDLIVDAVVHCLDDDVGFIVSYGGEGFFESSYSRIQPNEIRDILSAIPERVAKEWDVVQQTIMQNKWLGIDESCRALSGIKKLPNNFKRDIRMQADTCSDDIKSALDFARHMSIVGKGYDTLKCLQIERQAGKFLNLSFEKL